MIMTPAAAPPALGRPSPPASAEAAAGPAAEAVRAALDPLAGEFLSPWDEALLAATLYAVDPLGLGGIRLRALPGPARDRWLAYLRALLGAGTGGDTGAPAALLRRVPLSISDDRLLGGLDLAETLRAGRPIARAGLLAESDGGVLLLPMAERVSEGIAARLAATLDTGEVMAEREGLAFRAPARIGLVALDEGYEDDERIPDTLTDRLALHIDLAGLGHRDCPETEAETEALVAARQRLPDVVVPDEAIHALCLTALTLGVFSLRAPLQAVKVARAAAALDGRDSVDEEDLILAARLALAPRATRLPPPPPPPEQDQPPNDPPPPPPDDQTPPDDPPEDEQDETEMPPLEDILLAAAQAAIPAGLLARLKAGGTTRKQGRAGKAGANAPTAGRGRPIGVRGGPLKPGARLNLIATLRAAAPWQRVRRNALMAQAPTRPLPPVLVQSDDFRFTRYRKRRPTTTIFVVDASGSAAMARLAEAKGAVELLLADCYVRRDQVALVAFRGKGADLLLPPTRSLVRAKRGLAGLPGGGGTPLAAGIELAGSVAAAVAHHGETPVLVFLTDGRANVRRDGIGGRAQAQDEALKEARELRAQGLTCLLIDTANRPDARAQALAQEMDARYIPLPHADAAAISVAASAAARTASRADGSGGPPRRRDG